MTLAFYLRFAGMAWWRAYDATPLPAAPPFGSHYFTTILWRRDSFAGAQCHPPHRFKQGCMGGWAAAGASCGVLVGWCSAQDALCCIPRRWAMRLLERASEGAGRQAGLWTHVSFSCAMLCPAVPCCAGRDLKAVSGSLGGAPLRVCTTHLESPLGGPKKPMWEERRAQVRGGKGWS